MLSPAMSEKTIPKAILLCKKFFSFLTLLESKCKEEVSEKRGALLPSNKTRALKKDGPNPTPGVALLQVPSGVVDGVGSGA